MGTPSVVPSHAALPTAWADRVTNRRGRSGAAHAEKGTSRPRSEGTSPSQRPEPPLDQCRAVRRIRSDELIFGRIKDLMPCRMSLRYLCVIPKISQSVLSLIEQLAGPWFSPSPVFLQASFALLLPPSARPFSVAVRTLNLSLCCIDASLRLPQSCSATTLPVITDEVAARRVGAARAGRFRTKTALLPLEEGRHNVARLVSDCTQLSSRAGQALGHDPSRSHLALSARPPPYSSGDC